MVKIDIPGFGLLRLEHLVSDFTGTLSVNGKLLSNIKGQLNKIAKLLNIHILTADTFGKVKEELKGINCVIRILQGANEDIQKEKYVRKLGWDKVVAIGNGNNDRKMLKIARIGIVVTEAEGASIDALMNADIIVKNASDALNLLLNPKRFKATLRF